MAFIKIISIPGGGAATCSKYFYGPRTPTDPGFIRIGEVGEVPDDELAQHLKSGKVMQVLENAEPQAPKRGRPPKAPEGFDAVFAAQRHG